MVNSIENKYSNFASINKSVSELKDNAFNQLLTSKANLNIDGGSGDDFIIVNDYSQGANINGGSGDDTIIIGGPAPSPQPPPPSEPEVPSEPPPPPSPEPWQPFGEGESSDPLILDMDKDGRVEATAGKGVDIDGDGKMDGAASGGDKMLAMGDLNGNGRVDGSEVFGNETVNPFTGEKFNAANGFEALKMIAESARRHTGIDCMDDNGNVDVQKLKTALESVGVDLGLISDDNVTNLESLGDIATINTHYTEQNDSGDVQHRQSGNYTDTNGQTHKADDVWF